MTRCLRSIVAALLVVLVPPVALAGPAERHTLVCQIDRSNDEDPDGCMGLYLRCKAPGDKDVRLVSFIKPLIALGWTVDRQDGDTIFLHRDGPLPKDAPPAPAHTH